MQLNDFPVHIVVPTYNEAQNIPILLDEIFGLHLHNVNVLIVDDNSPDNTGAVAKSYAESKGFSVSILKRDRKSGLGTAYVCLLYTSPSPRDKRQSRMPSSA